MKVLIIAEDLLPGGATVVLHRIVDFYQQADHEVTCITGSEECRVDLPEPFVFDRDAVKGGLRLGGRMRELPAMRRLLKRYAPDLIVLNVSSPGYMYAFMLQRLPVLYHMHADIKPGGSALRKLIYPRLRGGNKKVITVSDWHGRHIREHWGVRAEHVSVLPNYPVLSVRMKEERDIILTAARFHWSKNPALWKVAGIRLQSLLHERGMRMIWCAPRWTEEARTMQDSMPPCMEIVIAENRDVLRNYFSRTAVYLQPSILEPQGIAVLEAMQNGIPCVVSDDTGMSGAVRHDVTGLIAPQGDTDAHVRALEKLILNGSETKRLGEAARALVESEYTAQAWECRYRDELLRSVLSD